MREIPLGRQVDYPDTYAPECLAAVARRPARAALAQDTPGSRTPLPFHGGDIWNARELTWLADSGCPQIADLELHIPADSPNLVESKSLKLYLGSFAMSRFASAEAVGTVIRADIEAVTGAAVDVTLRRPGDLPVPQIDRLPGACIDDQDVVCELWHPEPALLAAEPAIVTTEDLHSHVLRSLCPVTGQPDFGSVLVSYRGPRIDPAALLRYIASFRQHADFHETCVERMFLDIRERCAPASLTVYARYQRRGGIDINPWRSTEPAAPPNLRLWRQ